MTYHFRDADGPLTLEQDSGRDEPRIHDLTLAERLGFDRPRKIRDLIERNTLELEAYAILSCRTTKSADASGRGRPGKEYWLTEGQALVICALSRTPKAAAVRKLVIEVFMAWRREHEMRTVHVKEHDRRPPTRALPVPTKIAQSIKIAPTADPDLMRFEAVIPSRMAYDWVGAFAAYQQTIVTGLTQQI